MAVLDIIRMGHPTLRQIAQPYPFEDIGSPAFHSLIKDMRDTLSASGGIGLAAPQVNIPLQLAVIEIGPVSSRYRDMPVMPFSIFINPTITVLGEETAGYWEGCLSVPGMRGFVERSQQIQIDYLDGEGKAQTIRPTGFLATVFQHELDHLQGRLYVDLLKDPSLFAFDEEFQQFLQDPA